MSICNDQRKMKQGKTVRKMLDGLTQRLYLGRMATRCEEDVGWLNKGAISRTYGYKM